METRFNKGARNLCFIIAGGGLLLALLVGVILEDVSLNRWQDARQKPFDTDRGFLGTAHPEATKVHSRLWHVQPLSTFEDG
jgi:hypothetical protein